MYFYIFQYSQIPLFGILILKNPVYRRATPKSHFLSHYFVIFIIPLVRDPLIRDLLLRETPYMGWDFFVPTTILYPNNGGYNKITEKIKTSRNMYQISATP